VTLHGVISQKTSSYSAPREPDISIILNDYCYYIDRLRLCFCGKGYLKGPLSIPDMIYEQL
jgi:hypothetical protein